jgi:hypothetical protein
VATHDARIGLPYRQKGRTSYPADSVSITGTYTANPGDQLALKCITTGASDVMLLNSHLVITKATQSGGVSSP